MEKRKTVSLCLIVRNEALLLERCLNSVRGLVDEIIAVDTGSTDNTKEIALRFGAKIYDYPWNDNFSEARNCSLTKAACDWILLLDADEELCPQDREKFIHLINTCPYDGCHFTVRNYMSGRHDYTLHKAFRLLRNNGQYEFCGEIHEQIARKDRQPVHSRFSVEDIAIYHYGYLPEIVTAKKKRERNLPILLKQVEANPQNAFHLFNLGNEYLAQNRIDDALCCYEKAYVHMDKSQAYAPHLFYRMIICLNEKRQFPKALRMAEEALQVYPRCTDIAYCKGLIYVRQHNHLLAADAFRRCLDLGDPPGNLKFLEGCGTYRPFLSLGEIYLQNGAYDQAIEYFTKAINLDNTHHAALYALGEAYAQKHADQNIAAACLARYFSGLEHIPNSIVYIDILIKEKIYGPAQAALERIRCTPDYQEDITFLQSKLHFFTQNYQAAYEGFKKIADSGPLPSVLPGLQTESIRFMAIIGLLLADLAAESLAYLKLDSDPVLFQVYEGLHALRQNKKSAALNADPAHCLQIIDAYLAIILKAGEFDLFIASLEIFNLVNSNKVLLHLAKLYHQNGHPALAAQTVLQSIKQLDTVDLERAFLLWQDFIYLPVS
jgi:glycosyltransferase involved in cell wall biosynthesis/Tfp pilus assembly protein PilF